MDPVKCKYFASETGTHPHYSCTLPCPHCGYGEHLWTKDTWNAFTGKVEIRCARCGRPWPYPRREEFGDGAGSVVTVCEAREAKESK